MKKIKRTEEALRTATTDYILARRDKQVAEAKAVTAEAALAKEREQAAHKVFIRLYCHSELSVPTGSDGVQINAVELEGSRSSRIYRQNE